MQCQVAVIDGWYAAVMKSSLPQQIVPSLLLPDSGSGSHVRLIISAQPCMGAGTGGAGWASAHPGKNQGGHGPPWKF